MPRSRFYASPALCEKSGTSTAAQVLRTNFTRVVLFAVSLTIICAMTTMALAQSTTGSIYGQITDPSNAFVVGARIKATNQATGVVYPGSSDAQGNYAVFNLLPGIYQVTVEKEGFQTATISDVRIVIDQK